VTGRCGSVLVASHPCPQGHWHSVGSCAQEPTDDGWY
jgi:hypothetical protein